ncbi:hypothetical protein MPTA5024_02105 [Microbispora sp. ATCC PTA-5024]|nr:hypothetical protein MPTA5024_02105 [Microbispora sp. ATCC PTA-5024]
MRCGNTLSDDREAPDLRFVTVAFCDLARSTELAARLRPEVWSGVLDAYFTEVGGALSRAGGRLEKFIGDAIVAVFGAGNGGEDDAVNAANAARAAMDGLAGQAESLRRRGIELSIRFGLASGRVVATGRDSSFAIGAVMNRAARLQAAAPENGAAVDLKTWLLIRHAVPCRPLPPVQAKGFDKPLRAWRLSPPSDDGEQDPNGEGVIRYVNQVVLRQRLSDRLSRMLAEPSGTLLAIEGDVGVGKTRLVRELCAQAETASGCRVVMLSCPPIGDHSGLGPLTRLDRLLASGAERRGDEGREGPQVPRAADELRLAIRRRLSEMSRERPVLVAIDDYQWASDHLRAFVDGVDASLGPLAFLLSGRQVKLGDGARAERAVLEPLEDEDAYDLLGHVAAALGVPEPRDRADEVVKRGGGNPLFLEQLVALAAEGGDDLIAPSAEAALGARLDRLGPAARRVLACSAAWGADADLVDLAATCGLADKDFDLAVGELSAAGFLLDNPRDHHVGSRVVAEVAYSRLTLADQADVHSRITRRLQERARQRPDAMETASVHAERAYGALCEFDPDSPEARDAGRRAAMSLCSAARLVAARSEIPLALELAGRAAHLCGDDQALRLEIGAVETYALAAAGKGALALERIAALQREIPAKANLPAAAHLKATEVAIRSTESGWDGDLLAEATSLAERAGEAGGRSRLLLFEGLHHARAGDYATAEHLLREALTILGAENCFGVAEIYGNLALCLAYGDTPVPAALAECLELRARTADTPVLQAAVSCPAAFLHGRIGDRDEAVRLLREAENVFRDADHRAGMAGALEFGAMLAELDGDHARAAEAAGAAADLYERIGFVAAAFRCRSRMTLMNWPGAAPPAGDGTGSWDVRILREQLSALQAHDAGDSAAAGAHLKRTRELIGMVRGAGAVAVPILEFQRTASLISRR